MGVVEVFDERNSAFRADDPSFLDAVLVESDESLGGEVSLHFSTYEEGEPDVGVGNDVGDNLLKTEVFGLTGTAQCRACIADALFIEVRTHGDNSHRAVGIP